MAQPYVGPPASSASVVRLADVESPGLRQGLRAATSGDFTTAEQIFRQLLDEDPTSASVWSNLGNVHMSQGRAQEAYSDFSKAIGLAPTAPVPYLNRAIALEELGLQLQAQGQQQQALDRWNDAVRDCETAIHEDGQEFAAWFNKGNVEMRLQQFDTALQSYSRAADLAPGIAGYRLRAAQLQYQCGYSEGAVRTVKGVLRKNPNYAEAHATLAAMLWSGGQQAAAEEQLSRALEIGGRWRDMAYVGANTRWPPALVDAMQKLLSIQDV